MADLTQWLACVKGVSTNIHRLDMTIQAYDLNALSVEQIKVDRTKVTNFRKQLDEIFMAVFKLCKTEIEVAQHSSDMDVHVQFLDKMDVKLADWEYKFAQLRVARDTPVKLPSIDLMTFDGQYSEWLAFRDVFSAAIIKNKVLSGAQKLQYLKSSLKGDAERVVKSFPVTDANFAEAWRLLIDRYDNTREVVFALIRKLYNQPLIKAENPNALKKLIDTSLECVRSLKTMSRPVDHWDDLLVYIISEKLDCDTKREWARTMTGIQVPTWAQFITFLENHVRTLMAVNPQRVEGQKAQVPQRETKTHTSQTASGGNASSCYMCEQSHMLYQCAKFTSLSVQERVNFVKSKRLCFNCMSKHNVRDCKSKGTCKHCKLRHNSLLHFDKPQTRNAESNATQTVSSSSPKNVLQAMATNKNCGVGIRVLMATAMVKVQNSAGQLVTCRVLLDSGSEASFITQKCSESLGLKRRRSTTTVTGVSGMNAGRTLGKVTLNLKSSTSEFLIVVEALILSKVTGNLPSFEFKESKWPHLAGLSLADPLYFKSREVDIILGADIVASLMLPGKASGPPFTPIALETELGWILSGKVDTSSVDSLCVSVFHSSVEDQLQKFWLLESVPEREQFTKEELECETHFRQTSTRETDGRYVVRLPFNSQIKNLGASRDTALKRLYGVERRLNRLTECGVQYKEFMKEYLDMGHMEHVPAKECGEVVGKTNYLPHHFVVRNQSTTTKLRVVFDGATKTSTGFSLNECLHVGPNLLPDIFEILVRFRVHRVAIKADMVKCFRQFQIHKEDRDFQRILWRWSPTEQVQEFRLVTVTYGTSCGPYLANRCIRQLCNDEENSFPRATAVARKDFYVDDLLTGVSSVSEGVSLVEQMKGLMASAKLELRKWDSNSGTILQHIEPELHEVKGTHSFDKSDTNKALGVAWDSRNDALVYTEYKPQVLDSVTKRAVLSELARVFDPLGLLSPVTILVKLFFQELWNPIKREDGEMTCVQWDDPLPSSVCERWEKYHENLIHINRITIPRCIDPFENCSREIHGFCDASEMAYGAVVYLRCVESETVRVSIVAAKTKVAPLKQISLPRLELCAALLLARLIAAITQATSLECPISAWSDSEVALRWISCSSRRWKTFVANRVAEIQETIPGDSWHYVPTDANPADCASRGVLGKELAEHKLWWSGPSWLSTLVVPRFVGGQVHWPEVKTEQRAAYVISSPSTSDVNILQRFSTLTRMRYAMAYVLRFIFNCRTQKSRRAGGPISRDELEAAFLCSVRISQRMEFALEVDTLTKSSSVRAGKLCSLNPFLDSQGTMRVGGRVKCEANKQQIILSGHSHITKLIVNHFHIQLLHANFQLLWSTLSRKYWILRARSVVRQLIRKCITCIRYRAETAGQMMGQLPAVRTTPSRPFTHCGVDYAGPVTLQAVKGRGKVQFKGYFCVFVCMATKAVHLEAVTELTSDAFIATLKRFISRRGAPSDLYSDQGTNFIGAEKELKRFAALAKRDESLVHFFNENAIRWHFNPPSAPHMGGLWEAGVKSAKYHLKRVIGGQTLSLEEYFTLLAQVEAALNSRPLCPLSTEPEDCDALTPGHFLVGQPLKSLPEPCYIEVNPNRLSRWQRTQQMFQHFWKRWSAEYLHTLQQRNKWKLESENVGVGDLVLIKDGNTAPMCWPMGRIIEVHEGSDGLVRVVTIKTAKGQYQRPVVKIVPLVSSESADCRQQILPSLE